MRERQSIRVTQTPIRLVELNLNSVGAMCTDGTATEQKAELDAQKDRRRCLRRRVAI